MTADQRRAALVERLADHVLVHGLGSATLRPLAAAVGTSDRMLLYYFPDKAALVAAILITVAARMTVLLDAHRVAAPLSADALHAQLLPLVLDDALWPFMQLWLEIAAHAARGDAVCRRVGEGIARGFVAWLAPQIAAVTASSAQADAVRLLMSIEGGVLLKSLGLGAEVAAASLGHLLPPSRRPG